MVIYYQNVLYWYKNKAIVWLIYPDTWIEWNRKDYLMKKQPQIMEKERLGAFIDAVLAIIMTILVLELEEPKTFELQAL